MIKYILPLLILTSITCNAQEIKQVTKFVEKKIKDKKIAGAVVMVSGVKQNHHFTAQGYQDIDTKTKMDTSSIFRIYSMTKPVTSVAILQLQEKDSLNIDDPITKYIPELKGLKVLKNGKKVELEKEISIRDLMRHTAGFTYGFFSNTEVDKLYKKNNPLFVSNNEQFISKVADLPLLNQPGEKYHYSIATDILGVIVEKASGMKLSQYFDKFIFEPLGMHDTGFYVPEKDKDRFCTNYSPKLKVIQTNKSTEFVGENEYRRESGGGGLVSTASDYMKFGLMLLGEGNLNGVTILNGESIIEMTMNQLKEDDTASIGTGFGLGVSVQLKEWGNHGHEGDFGWNGAASTHFIASGHENVVIIILTQIMPYSHQMMKGIKPIVYKTIES